MEKSNSKNISVMIGISGVLLVIISLFLPYIKAGNKTKSLVGIVEYYLNSNTKDWYDKEDEMFYKIFETAMVSLIVIFALIFLIQCIKHKIRGMVVSTVLTIIPYELIKWDFADRHIVPGWYDRGIAYTSFYIAFAVMIVAIIMNVIEKSKNNKIRS